MCPPPQVANDEQKSRLLLVAARIVTGCPIRALRSSLAILRDEILVHRHGGRAPANDVPDVIERLLRFLRRQTVRERVVAGRLHALADQQVQPALHREQLLLVADDATIAAEELEALLEAVRQL